MPKKIKTRNEERNSSAVYWKKAEEFHDTMLSAQAAEKWNAVGLNAVHCVISAGDALLVRAAGLRSAGVDHKDVLHLLSVHIKEAKPSGALNHFDAVIRKKNLIEYEGREFVAKEAVEIVKHVERFYQWAKLQIKH